MPNGPASAANRIQRVLKAWETLRPNKTFAGMTLPQFRDAIQTSFEMRDAIGHFENQLIAALNRRDQADAASLQKVFQVVNSVKGDPAEGDDSELYEAMGYVRKRDRKSGLSRKRNGTPVPSPA